MFIAEASTLNYIVACLVAETATVLYNMFSC